MRSSSVLMILVWVSVLEGHRHIVVKNHTWLNNTSVAGIAVHTKKQCIYEMKKLENKFRVFINEPKKVIKMKLHDNALCEGRWEKLNIEEEQDESILVRINADFTHNNYPYYVCSDPPSIPKPVHSRMLIANHKMDWLAFLLILYVTTLVFSALFTGLNLALMSLDMDHLILIRDYDEDREARQHATNIIPIRQNGNYMLCTIILGNTLLTTANAMLFDAMVSDVSLPGPWEMIAKIIVPAVFILIFSEILPQVFCAKYALKIGSFLRFPMVFFMVLTAPVSWPLAKLLDLIIGREIRSSLDDKMISGIMKQHKENKGQLIEVVENALSLQSRTAKSEMTAIEKVFMLSDRTFVNQDLKRIVSHTWHTRIPVYKGDDKNHIRGLLNMKDVLLIDTDYEISVAVVLQLRSNSKAAFRFVSADTGVPQLMKELKDGFPLSIVVEYRPEKRKHEVVGIVTLEDNLEAVIGQIYDEKEVHHRATSPDNKHTTKTLKVIKGKKKPAKDSPHSPLVRSSREAEKEMLLDRKKAMKDDRSIERSNRKKPKMEDS